MLPFNRMWLPRPMEPVTQAKRSETAPALPSSSDYWQSWYKQKRQLATYTVSAKVRVFQLKSLYQLLVNLYKKQKTQAYLFFANRAVFTPLARKGRRSFSSKIIPYWTWTGERRNKLFSQTALTITIKFHQFWNTKSQNQHDEIRKTPCEISWATPTVV